MQRNDIFLIICCCFSVKRFHCISGYVQYTSRRKVENIGIKLVLMFTGPVRAPSAPTMINFPAFPFFELEKGVPGFSTPWCGFSLKNPKQIRTIILMKFEQSK